MTFWRHHHQVTLHGEALLKSGPGLASCTVHELLPGLLEEFRNLFSKPCSLPPPRHWDCCIHMVVHPYRYPAVQRDEIERQCMEMLKHGLIRPTKSGFSSPVLIVKKPDKSWPSALTTVHLIL